MQKRPQLKKKTSTTVDSVRPDSYSILPALAGKALTNPTPQQQPQPHPFASLRGTTDTYGTNVEKEGDLDRGSRPSQRPKNDERSAWILA